MPYFTKKYVRRYGSRKKGYKKYFRSNRRYGLYNKNERRRAKMAYTITRSIGQPDTIFLRLKYNEVIQKVPAGITTDHIFRGNSLFDPNYSGGGGQPIGFDQYANIYTHYEVLASSISVRLCNNQSANVGCALYPSYSVTQLSYDDAICQSYAKSGIVGALTGQSIKIFKNFMATKKLLGRSTNSVNYAAPVTGDPNNVWYWHLDFRSMDGQTAINLSLEVVIVYYAKFYQRTQLVDV